MPPLEWRPTALDRYEPTEEEWREYAEWSDRLDALHALAGYPAEFPPSALTDEDILAAGGAVG
jgi:hypothetical protein